MTRRGRNRFILPHSVLSELQNDGVVRGPPWPGQIVNQPRHDTIHAGMAHFVAGGAGNDTAKSDGRRL